MKTFVADIIPRIQKVSQKLNNLTLLTNQHWVVLDELHQSKTVYIFRKTNELLISKNGEVEKAKWEYLGQNSILIDINEKCYLFRHGFFDENVLALKIDSREEYAVLVNESKYQGELNSITAVLHFLKKKYFINADTNNPKFRNQETIFSEFQYQRDGYTIRMGSFKEYIVRLSNGQTIYVYQKISNGKYYIYSNNEIILFADKDALLKYLENIVYRTKF